VANGEYVSWGEQDWFVPAGQTIEGLLGVKTYTTPAPGFLESGQSAPVITKGGVEFLPTIAPSGAYVYKELGETAQDIVGGLKGYGVAPDIVETFDIPPQTPSRYIVAGDGQPLTMGRTAVADIWSGLGGGQDIIQTEKAGGPQLQSLIDGPLAGLLNALWASTGAIGSVYTLLRGISGTSSLARAFVMAAGPLGLLTAGLDALLLQEVKKRGKGNRMSIGKSPRLGTLLKVAKRVDNLLMSFDKRVSKFERRTRRSPARRTRVIYQQGQREPVLELSAGRRG